MKKKILLLFFTTIILNGCTSNKYNGVVNVLNWSSYIPDSVISDFEREYNIKVNYGTYSSNEELLAKITSSKRGTYDVIFPSDYMIDLMIQRNILEPLDKNRLENYKNINTLFLRQNYDYDNTYSLPFLLATSVIAYNSENVSGITKYSDLKRPEYKNDIVLLDDERIIIGAMMQSLGYDLNDYDEVNLEGAYKEFEEIKPNIKAFDSDSPKTFLITGEANIGLIWNAEALLAKEENPNIEIIYPSDGYALSMDNYAIVKDAPNIDNAYLFISYLLRDDVCKKIVEEYPYISTNRNVVTLTNNEIKNILSNGEYVSNIGENIKNIDKMWARFK